MPRTASAELSVSWRPLAHGCPQLPPLLVKFMGLMRFKHCSFPALRRKQHADFTAFRPQRPRCHQESINDQRGDHMKVVSAVTAHRSAGCDRTCQVKEDARIDPLFEQRITWRQDRNGPKHLPESQDGEEIHWVAKLGHHAMGVNPKLPKLRESAASDKECDEDCHRPINNGFCFHGHSIPPTTRSRLPMNFCQPDCSMRRCVPLSPGVNVQTTTEPSPKAPQL